MLARHAVFLTPLECAVPKNTQGMAAPLDLSTTEPFEESASLNELLCFHAFAHSFPQRRPLRSFRFKSFRTLFVATGGVPPSCCLIQPSREESPSQDVARAEEPPSPVTNHESPVSSQDPRSLLTSLLSCFLASRGAPRAACYTVPPMARQRLGQHFLADLHWREEIARAIRVSPHSTVPLPRDNQHCWIEIGSGHGEMTQHLLAAGAPVHAIELDAAFLPGLRHLAKQFPNLNVISGDILKTDIAAIASRRRIRLYGNLPYYITSPILRHPVLHAP